MANKREISGAVAELLQDIETEDFRNFVRISVADFNLLVERLTPFIEKQNTVMRKAITTKE